MTVATIDYNITVIQMGDQQVNKIVHRLASFYQQHDFTRTLQTLYQFLNAKTAADVFSLGASRNKGFNFGGGTIKNRDRKTFAFHIQHQIFPHDSETNQSNILLVHINYFHLNIHYHHLFHTPL